MIARPQHAQRMASLMLVLLLHALLLMLLLNAFTQKNVRPDAAREYAYDRDSHVGRLVRGLDDAAAQGWTVIDMQADWGRVFGFDG
jgi:hypothetical protein